MQNQLACNPSPTRLWTRLADFLFDGPGTKLTFARRLARENAWPLAFSARVIEEYRRFLFLCCDAGHPVTPSDAVDQAWHLHLTATRSYWEDLCRDTLGRPVHHDPTRGGEAEDHKFRDLYSRTLEAYAARFGPPPSDIWPSVEARFAPQRFERVDRSRHIVLPRTTLRTVGGAVGALALLTGCVSTLSIGLSSSSLWFLGGFLLVALTVERRARKRSRPKERRRRRRDRSSATQDNWTTSHGCGYVSHGGEGHGHGFDRDRDSEGDNAPDSAVESSDSGVSSGSDSGGGDSSSCSSGCSGGGD